MAGTRFAGLYTFDGTTVDTIWAMGQTRQWMYDAETGMDAQLGTDSIQIKVGGFHFVNCALSFYGDADVTYFVELRVNGAREGSGLMAAQEVTVVDKAFHVSVFGAGYLKVGDLVSVYVGSDELASFQMVYGQFGVMAI